MVKIFAIGTHPPNQNTTVVCEPIESVPKPGRRRLLHPKEELFITLCRSRQGFGEEHLAHLYGVSQATISRIIITWVNFLYLKFKDVPMWPSRELINKHMPQQFKEKYPSTRVIIDCTEVQCQMPSSLRLNSELFSSYKNHITLKALVGITPGGALLASYTLGTSLTEKLFCIVFFWSRSLTMEIQSWQIRGSQCRTCSPLELG